MKITRLALALSALLLSYTTIKGMDAGLEDGWEMVGKPDPAPLEAAATFWKFWDVAERCKSSDWTSIIEQECHKIIGYLPENALNQSETTLKCDIHNIKTKGTCPENKTFQSIVNDYAFVTGAKIKTNWPSEKDRQKQKPLSGDTLIAYQILFCFYQYNNLMSDPKTNEACHALAQEFLKKARELEAKRLAAFKAPEGLPYNYLAKPVKVSSDHKLGSISTEEHDWLRDRLRNIDLVQKVLFEDLLQASIDKPQTTIENNPLRIGIVCSGGGFRAMTATSGYLAALKKLGIFDASLYVSGLSGSTWFLVPWLISGKTLEEYRQSLAYKIADANIAHLATHASPEFISAFIHDIIVPKALYGKPVSSTDMFGSLLGYALLEAPIPLKNGDNSEKNVRHKTYNTFNLMDLAQRIRSADKPFPIFTAVCDHSLGTGNKNTKWYAWNEFTPYSFENVDLTLRIPGYAFGSKFEKGRPVEISPHQESLGSLMGMWGSAYTINLANEIDQGHVGKVASWALWAGSYVVPSLEKLYEAERFYPAIAHNPFFDLTPEEIAQRFEDQEHAKPITGKETTTFVDAGIDFNLPIFPLLKDTRKLDVIIVVDSSGGISKRATTSCNKDCPKELAKFFEKAKHLGVEYEEIPLKGGKGFYAYKPLPRGESCPDSFIGEKLPMIIYINFECDRAILNEAQQSDPYLAELIANNKLMDFDPATCLKGYGNTFNFKYSSSEFNQLSAMAECNVLARKTLLMSLLQQAYLEKLELTEAQPKINIFDGIRIDEDYLPGE